MNTRASVAYGWGILCLAGGGAYYFAKRSINSDRAERAAAEEQRRQQRERLRVDRHLTSPPPEKDLKSKRAPNAEKVHNGDPAPVDHAHERGKETADSAAVPQGKFEAKEPFRSRKGDRFS